MPISKQVPMGIARDGFRSLFERSIAVKLERKGIAYAYESEAIPFTVEHKYTPDFKLPNGIFIEAKGWFLPEDRTKLITVKQQWPNIDLRLVFQRNGRLSKKSKTTYGAWADKHGFKWAVGEVPQAWIDEHK